MRVLLVGPDRRSAQVCGDDIVTRVLLSHPPTGVRYDHFEAALQSGAIARTRWTEAWLASLCMHSRPPAGVPYVWGPLPPWRYRLWGRLLPDRPDEDVQWLAASRADRWDLLHAWAYPVGLVGALRRLPLILHAATGNTDLLRNYYGYSADLTRRVAARDTRLLRALGVAHDLYATQQARCVIVASRYAWDLHLAAGVPEHKLRLLRIGLESPPKDTLAVQRDPSVCRFTLVGHQFWRKGGRAVVAAFARLRARHPEARLTIVSAVAPQDLGIDLTGVELIPALPRELIYQTVYPRTDVLLLPSLAEGYGMSVVEGMSFGLPVIASRISALPELVQEGVSGLLVPPDDPEALEGAMRRLLESSTLRVQFGQAGRAAFVREHALPVTQAGLRRIYQEVLHG
ncbi:MAG: glycosyltransferase family 4 protein [Candidatus Sericytochromatia bacterium]|nr:glycosyltransferase family 4 protein [Candidatus Sericytochromatia bacterium]